MLRVKISNFIKKHINKIRDLGIRLIIVAIVVIIATIILSSFDQTKVENKNNLEVYKPMETVIKGEKISEKQYKSDFNVVEKFLKLCNEKRIEEAYELISYECREELYPTIDYFKENYYNIIFSKERLYNLQSWISTNKYTVYKIRYTNNMLLTGIYEEDDVYQDYITLHKNSSVEEISIGNLIAIEKCNIKTEIDELEAKVIRKKIYVSDEEYEINVTNKTDKTILLDTLNTNENIRLIGSSGAEYGAYTNKLFLNYLEIEPGMTKTVTIKFKKSFSSENKSEKIKFSNIVTDYNKYLTEKEDYKDIVDIAIRLED